MWRKERLDFAQTEGLSTFPALESRAQAYHGPAAEFLAQLDEGALSARVELPWAESMQPRLGRAPQATTLGDTRYQVAAHSNYHRGQINRRIRELGGEPPLVDYIVGLARPAGASVGCCAAVCLIRSRWWCRVARRSSGRSFASATLSPNFS